MAARSSSYFDINQDQDWCRY